MLKVSVLLSMTSAVAVKSTVYFAPGVIGLTTSRTCLFAPLFSILKLSESSD